MSSDNKIPVLINTVAASIGGTIVTTAHHAPETMTVGPVAATALGTATILLSAGYTYSLTER